MKKNLACALCLLLLTRASVLWAVDIDQLDIAKSVLPGRFSPGFTYQSWTRSSESAANIEPRFKEDIKQYAIQTSLSYHLFPGADLRIDPAYAWSDGEQNNSLRGFDGTQIQFSYTSAAGEHPSVATDRPLLDNFLLIGRLKIPTRKEISDEEKGRVSEALFGDLVDFSLKRYEEGLSVDLGAIGARKVGPFAIAAGLGVLHGREYQTWISGEDGVGGKRRPWNPQDELRFTSGVNLLKGDLAWHSGLTYALFRPSSDDVPELKSGFFVENDLTYEILNAFTFEWDVSAQFIKTDPGYQWPKTILSGRLGGRWGNRYTKPIGPFLSFRFGLGVRGIPDDKAKVANAVLYSSELGFRIGSLDIPFLKQIQLDVEIMAGKGHENIIDKDDGNKFHRVDLTGVGVSLSIHNSFDFGL
ncbi:MAG: hypothetical protein O7C75_00705 [Verrucomicrobia bacterium]|nr:hypothetical protein [Verrucomicrobiota bacterium]